MFTCYSTLQKINNVQYDAGFTNSGEVIFPINLSNNSGIDPTGFNMLRGQQTSGNPDLITGMATMAGSPYLRR